MRRPYFRTRPGDPLPLGFLVRRTVRFEEVDSLGIVWHGRYPSYFEDARVALGARCGLGYDDFRLHGVPAPIKRLFIDYHRPLRFGDEISIEALLHWNDAARLDFEFIIRDGSGRTATTGFSVQIMLDHEHNVLYVPPPFVAEMRERWRRGEFS